MRTGKEGRREGGGTHKKIKSPGLSHLDNRRYFHSSSGSFDSTPLVYSTPPPPPFPSYRRGQSSVRTNVRRQAGRQASPTRSRSCLPGTDRRSRPGRRKKQLKVSNRLSTCHKKTQKRQSSPTSVECPGPCCVYCPYGQTPYSIRGIFSADFFRCCKCHSGSQKKQERGGLKKKRRRKAGETRRQRERIP